MCTSRQLHKNLVMPQKADVRTADAEQMKHGSNLLPQAATGTCIFYFLLLRVKLLWVMPAAVSTHGSSICATLHTNAIVQATRDMATAAFSVHHRYLGCCRSALKDEKQLLEAFASVAINRRSCSSFCTHLEWRAICIWLRGGVQYSSTEHHCTARAK
jgi:hypothetical protein